MPTVAPKERVNIVYKPATGDAQAQVELPLKIMMIGDFTGKPDETPVEDRKPISLDKDNFADVMKGQNLEITINVADKLSGEEGAEVPVSLKFSSLKDFEPEGIVNQVPQLRKLLELRKALTALKGPLGNFPTFKKRIQAILGDEKSRESLKNELGITDGDAGAST
ncbi:MAG: type VI secretion system contractile sheath small subunit [Deltaproteobacteria bacterium]|nr:type VI secretion system contractile sheath small subunit [Deltaproteobacteria bacterium]